MWVADDVRAAALVLEAERAARHSYDDKFSVCEAMAALLAQCGLVVLFEGRPPAVGRGALRPALRFEGVCKCEFRDRVARTVERPVAVESGILGARISETHTVTSHLWNVTAAAELSVTVGAEKHVVWAREAAAVAESAENAAPFATEPLGPFVVEAALLWGEAFVFAR